MGRRWLALGIVLAGCDASPTAPPELAPAATVVPVKETAAAAGPPVPKGWSWTIAPAARPSLEQVVALAPDRALALGDGRLYALAREGWREVAVDAGRPRALAEGAGAMWVLVEGADGRAGRTLVMRASGCCSLSVSEDMSEATVTGASALAVVAARDVYLAGGTPRQVRVVEGKAREIAVGEAVTRLAAFGGDARTPGPAVIVWHGPRQVRIVRGDAVGPGVELAEGERVEASSRWLLTVRDGEVRAGIGAGATDSLVRGPGPKGKVFGLMPDGAPIAALTDAVAVWNRDAHSIEHTSEPDGSRGYFSVPRPAWASFSGALPREPIALLPTEPRMVAGREGELSRLEAVDGAFRATAIVAVPRPRTLAIVATGGRRALIGATGARRADGRIDVGELGREWLSTAIRDARPGAPPLFAAAGTGGILLAQLGRDDVLRVADDGARKMALPSWPRAIAATGAGAWVVLLGHGGVVRIDGETTREIGSLAPYGASQVSHPIGAFAGTDGRVRLVGSRAPLVCTDGEKLERCGDDPKLEPAHLHPLRDGLLSLTQAIRTMIVDASGGREVDNLWTRGEVVAVGGSAAAPVAIVAPRPPGAPALLRLGASGWETLAAIPETCVPQAIADDGASVLVGCEGETMLELR